MQLIETTDDIAAAVADLRAEFPEFGQVYDTCGPIPLRRKPHGFETLLHAIVGQQVSTASAAAIWARLQAAHLTTQDKVSQATDADLAGAGLSRPKIKYAHALAAHNLDFAALAHLDDDAVIATLVQVKGIGTWTAEVYALAALGRADVFPHGDLALQEAGKILFDWDARPNEKQMKQLALDWSPWRAVAARLLWAYYRHQKNREGLL